MRGRWAVLVLGWLLYLGGAAEAAQAQETPWYLSAQQPGGDAEQPADGDSAEASGDSIEIDLGAEDSAGLEDGAEQDASAEIDLGEAEVQGTAVAVTTAAEPAVEQVIDSGEIAASGAQSIAELLEREAGFTVTESFSGSEVAFQGLPSKFTTVLIDGQRVPGHIFERVDFGQLPLANLERVEIIRGPQAAAWGSDSAGVVVNLVTKQPAGVSGELGLGLGSLGYNRQQLAYGYATADGSRSFRLAAGRRQRDAYDLSPAFPDTDGDGYSQYDFLGGYQARMGADHFTLQLQSFREDARGLSFSPPDQRRSNETLTRRFQASASYAWALSGTGTLTLSQNWGSYYHDLYRYWIGYEDSTAVRSGFKDTLYDTHLQYQQYGSDYLLNAGVELNRDELTSDRISQGGRAAAEIRAAYATYEFLPLGDWSGSLALRLDDHDTFGAELSPKAALAYKPGAGSSLTLSAGRGYRSPSLRERYYEFASPFGYSVLGNPELTPETVWSYNLDFSRAAADRGLRLGLFRHEINDMIVFEQIQSSPQVFQTANVARARSTGLALSAQRSFPLSDAGGSDGAQLLLGYDATWVFDSEDTALATRLVHSPELDQRLRLVGSRPGASAELLVHHTSERYFDRENLVRAPAFTTVDLTLGFERGTGSWKLAGLNIFDERDGTYGPEPGRELRLEYMLNF